MKFVVVGDAMIGSGVFMEACNATLADTVVVTPLDYGNGTLTQLQAVNQQVERGGPAAAPDDPRIHEAVKDADVLLVHKAPVPARVIEAAQKLRVIGVTRGGHENVDVAAASERGIVVLTTPGRNAQAVAEFTVGLMLAETRNIARSHRCMCAGQWRKEFSNAGDVPELRGAVLGLIGFGEIGRRVARLAAAFGMRIAVFDPALPADAVLPDGCRRADLEELLAVADVISLHARLPHGAPPILGETQIQQIKRGAYLINTARSELVDEDALYRALSSGKLGGAALDVFWREPLPDGSRWRALDNVTLTAHLGGSTRRAWTHSPTLLLEAIRRLADGQTPPGIVNRGAVTRLKPARLKQAFRT